MHLMFIPPLKARRSPNQSGARTFLSAARWDGVEGPVASEAVGPPDGAADKNVRAPIPRTAVVPGARELGACLGMFLAAQLSAAEVNWPEFRGPQGNGISTSTNLLLHWGEQQNVKWRTPIHDRGWSSPVIWGQQIWLTTATIDGHQLFAISVDRDTAARSFSTKVF